MPRSVGNVIADSLALGVDYAERLLVGVTADKFARFAQPRGQIVESNHAAFIYGHLSLYGPRIVSQLGGNSAALTLPEQFELVFSKDAKCQDDPQGSIYPPMEEVTQAFFSGYHAAIDALRTVNDEALQEPNPAGGRMAERFPTIGSINNFLAGGHLMMHLGQVSGWRRMIGLGAA